MSSFRPGGRPSIFTPLDSIRLVPGFPLVVNVSVDEYTALAVWRLGAGRSRPGEQVQAGAGIQIHRRSGSPVAAGDTLFTLYTDTPERFPSALAELDAGYTVSDSPPAERPLIIDRITP